MLESNALPVDDDRYIKTKIIKSGDKVHTIFFGLNLADDGVKCESFTIISINSLTVYGKNIFHKYI